MPSSRAPWWLFVMAASFLAYFVFATYCRFWEPESEGFQLGAGTGPVVLLGVVPNSPAAKAGLEAGDTIVSVNGQRVQSFADWIPFRANLEVKHPLQLEIERDGRKLRPVLTLTRRVWTNLQLAGKVRLLGWTGAQLLTLILALLIAFSRPRDPVALLGAWLLATGASFDFVAPRGRVAVWRELPVPLSLLLWAPHISTYVLGGPIAFTFFANFPRRLFRRPWVCVLVWALALPAGVNSLLAQYRSTYHPEQVAGLSAWAVRMLSLLIAVGFVGGVATLVANYWILTELNERRRLRVLVVGSAAGALSTVLIFIAGALKGFASAFAQSLPVQMVSLVVFLAVPLSFAYAILHDRLFDIRVVVRRGLQYVLARGVVLALIPGLVAILLVDLVLHGNQTLIVILRERGWIYGVLVAFAFVAYSRRRLWLEALDKRYFREHYDAQQLLRELVEEVREASSFDRVASRAVARIEAALHPEFVALLVRDPREPTYRTVAAAPVGQAPPSLIAESKLVSLMRVLGKPLDISSAESSWLSQQLPHEETDFVRQARIELLIPIAMSLERKEALLALGQKRSEEPYTQEDQNLLVAIAASLALLLERPTTAPLRLSNAFEECPQCGECYDTGSLSCAQEGASLVPVCLPRLLTGRYLLRRRRGRGGMGTVYEALDTALDRRVAVKVVRDDLTGSSVAAERFRQEARVAASFTHPNVVTVYDFGVVANTRAFLVMEFLEGVTLREELRKDARFTTSRMLEILRGVCTAIDSAHRRQLVHRDLKPENVFLVRGDTGEVPKVVDFGLAKLLSTSPQETIDTDPGQAVGTMRYMAPEQLGGHEVDPAWDLWALTVMAYEMLAGANPFPGATTAECYRTILAANFTPISKHLPAAPGHWEEFFARAFALDPADRPTTARMFLSQLGRAFS